MWSSERGVIFRRKRHMKQYLEELGVLFGRPVNVDEIGDPKDVEAVLKASKFMDFSSQETEIDFNDLQSDRFRCFIQKLHAANEAEVHIFTPRTRDCGLSPSLPIIDVNFAFDFFLFGEKNIALITADMEDRLFLDFLWPDDRDEKGAVIKTNGKNWAGLSY